MGKKDLTETDLRTNYITPALVGAGGNKWDLMTQIREETYFTKGAPTQEIWYYCSPSHDEQQAKLLMAMAARLFIAKGAIHTSPGPRPGTGDSHLFRALKG